MAPVIFAFAVLVQNPLISEEVLTTGYVTDVETGFGWVEVGFQPLLTVHLADGSLWHFCHNGHDDPSFTCSAGAGTNKDIRCQLTELTIYAGQNASADNGNTAASYHHTHVGRRIPPLLALLTTAALKALPVQLKARGPHPSYAIDDCFDSVRLCFTGSCD
jgi:hypothetical protein